MENKEIIEENDRGITKELIQSILKNVKLIENISDTSKDELIKLYINITCSKILEKTNRRVFPKELEYVVTEITCDYYESNLSRLDLNGKVSKMSESGRSVEFGMDNVLTNKINLLVNKKLADYDIVINRYKLLYRT